MKMERKKVIVLGSTGSIGKQALDVIASAPERFELLGMAGGSNRQLLAEQIATYRPRFVAGLDLPEERIPGVSYENAGEEGILTLAAMPEADVVVNGISGFSALKPLLSSLKAGKRVALANKESIVCGKSLVDRYRSEYGGTILPVDSEQSALFQCMQCGSEKEIKRLILTCSGGRFWKKSPEELENITAEKALDHPTWNMGAKITIDSATLFNKGLEVIEACYLFDIPWQSVDVLIHPQSIVHSMVEFKDNTVIANMSVPDMRLPIQYAMTYPERTDSVCKPLSLASVTMLEFHEASPERYPALRLAYEALQAGGTMPVVYNGANEAAVALFRAGRIGFGEIYRAVEYAMQTHKVRAADTEEAIFAADRESRESVFNRYKH